MINDVYYLLKPYLPKKLRIVLRQLRAVRLLKTSSDVWPIDEAAGVPPPGWPGWPEGKRFALVLTHDVEGLRGLGRVEQLTRVDIEHGFRSSFNFVPEGEYRVPAALRRTLVQAGFEVGVHGLTHDGKLYQSKKEFAARADRIAGYLREWEATGFRSPAMHHNLAWLHRLELEYDSSTFDTDPFEPQPDGVGTIFPFWVAGPNGSGYVELPYTIPQDFTCFVILGYQNVDIWKRKLDWIAERGGMALLNTHRDYMRFDGEQPESHEVPVTYYEEFLSYAREKYGDDAWCALPRDVARNYRDQLPLASRNSRKKICMVAYTNYESDNRVRRYAEALARRGDHVDVIALTADPVPVGKDTVSGVNLYRIQSRVQNERFKWTYFWRLSRFLWNASVFLTRQHHRVRYDVIHVHNVPDFLVFAAWYPKWTGAKLILDIHDIVPELFKDKFSSMSHDPYVRLLKTVEKASAKFVDHVIVSNHLWRNTLISRSVSGDKCSVFINHVDLNIFHRRPRTRTDDKFVILFPGTFQRHQGLDVAIKALARLNLPNAELHLYGGGGVAAELAELAARLGVGDRVKFFAGVSLDEIANVIANADLGVVPKRADSFGNEAYSTKIMEFMSQGVPVVASRTKIDDFYFDETVLRFFESGDPDDLANAIRELSANQELRESLAAGGYDYARKNDWENKRRDYLELVDGLLMETFSDPAVRADASV